MLNKLTAEKLQMTASSASTRTNLTIDRLQISFHVASPGDRALRHRLLQLRNLRRCQLDLNRLRVLFKISPLLRPRNRHYILALGQHPRQRKLPRSNSSPLGNVTHAPYQRKVRIEVLPPQIADTAARESPLCQAGSCP